MCEQCRNNPMQRTALLAHADQSIARMRDELRAMVATYRRYRTGGRDLPLDIGAVILSNQNAYTHLELSQYLAVAIAMLAEQEPRP